MNNGLLKTTGVVTQVLGNNNFEVEITTSEGTKKLLCHRSGKMRLHNIGVIVGDAVRVDIPPPFDKGRITFRERG